MAKTDDGKAYLAGQDVYGQPVLIGSSFNRDFEVVYVNKGGNLVSWHYSQSAPGWYYLGNSSFGGLEGYPGFTQLDDSSFSVVVRTNLGGVAGGLFVPFVFSSLFLSVFRFLSAMSLVARATLNFE